MLTSTKAGSSAAAGDPLDAANSPHRAIAEPPYGMGGSGDVKPPPLPTDPTYPVPGDPRPLPPFGGGTAGADPDPPQPPKTDIVFPVPGDRPPHRPHAHADGHGGLPGTSIQFETEPVDHN